MIRSRSTYRVPTRAWGRRGGRRRRAVHLSRRRRSSAATSHRRTCRWLPARRRCRRGGRWLPRTPRRPPRGRRRSGPSRGTPAYPALHATTTSAGTAIAASDSWLPASSFAWSWPSSRSDRVFVGDVKWPGVTLGTGSFGSPALRPAILRGPRPVHRTGVLSGKSRRRDLSGSVPEVGLLQPGRSWVRYAQKHHDDSTV